MAIAILVGVNHAHQLLGFPRSQSEKFSQFIEQEARKWEADLLAEEMSYEALKRWKVKRSTVEYVAQHLNLPHIFCDPDQHERSELGILSRDEIQRNFGIQDPSNPEEDMLDAEERSFWPVREREWLNRLSGKQHQRLLFVLGPNHVESFSCLLREAGYEVRIISSRWDIQPDPKVN